MLNLMVNLLVTGLLIWYIIPHIVLHFYPVPNKDKVHGQWLKLSLTSLMILIPAFLAPLVVPIALLFTKWEDDKLPAFFWMWDNDVSLNGDERLDWDISNTKNAYYASAPPRSFYARWVWLGLRNRCSKLIETFGHRYAPGEFESRIMLGDKNTGRDHEGYKFVYTPNISQLMIIKRIGKLCIRFNWGWKFFDKPVTPFATISFSILSYKGE